MAKREPLEKKNGVTKKSLSKLVEKNIQKNPMIDTETGLETLHRGRHCQKQKR